MRGEEITDAQLETYTRAGKRECVTGVRQPKVSRVGRGNAIPGPSWGTRSDLDRQWGKAAVILLGNW